MPTVPQAKLDHKPPDGDLASAFRALLEQGLYVGKVPLFVLGAGISNKRVPFIPQMAERLVALVRSSEHTPTSVQKILIPQGEAIQAGRASRSDAAEFFSTCQSTAREDAMEPVWSHFCQELAIDGLRASDSQFTGLFRLGKEFAGLSGQESFSGPSIAHLGIASFLIAGACHVLNLNYDPLLLLAMSALRDACDLVPSPDAYHIIPLHTAEDIRAYYSSRSVEYQPSIVNARGDVFYARCTNSRCPEFSKDRSLDSRFATTHDDEVFRCTSCHLKSIKLQLSFPGYETKERLVQPILNQLREFLGFRTSAIVPIGLSGRWDPYLLSELFEWSVAYRVPIIDVKPDTPSASTPTSFEGFRRRYFASVPTTVMSNGPFYKQWSSTADDFIAWLQSVIMATNAYKELPAFIPNVSRQAQLPLR
jgi:hypothetical protein